MDPSPLTTSLPIATPAAAGGAGVATATVTDTKRIFGQIEGFVVKYAGSAPATTDVTITGVGSHDGFPDLVFLTLTNVNTNGFYPVRHQMRDSAGALIAGVFDRPVAAHQIKVDVAQADNGVIVTVIPVYHRAL